MRTIVNVFLILFGALFLDLASVITISTIRNLEVHTPGLDAQEQGILDCSMLSGRRPQPKINVFEHTADVELGNESFSSLKTRTGNYQKELALLQTIVETLEPHLPMYARGWKYRFFIGKSQDVNAYSLGGGIIIVNEGVFSNGPSVDFLAHVVAHEMGHTALRHQTHKESMTELLRSELVVLARARIDPPKTVPLDQLELLFRTRLEEYISYPSLSYELETEADVFASDVLARAGYNLSTVAYYYEQRAIELKEKRGTSDGSTHPPSKLRELILRCTKSRLVARPGLDTEFARIRGTIVTRHTLERQNALK
jgi:predicted Zn-dependent protease